MGTNDKAVESKIVAGLVECFFVYLPLVALWIMWPKQPVAHAGILVSPEPHVVAAAAYGLVIARCVVKYFPASGSRSVRIDEHKATLLFVCLPLLGFLGSLGALSGHFLAHSAIFSIVNLVVSGAMLVLLPAAAEAADAAPEDRSSR